MSSLAARTSEEQDLAKVRNLTADSQNSNASSQRSTAWLPKELARGDGHSFARALGLAAEVLRIGPDLRIVDEVQGPQREESG
jgi:hypothetical protein